MTDRSLRAKDRAYRTNQWLARVVSSSVNKCDEEVALAPDARPAPLTHDVANHFRSNSVTRMLPDGATNVLCEYCCWLIALF